MCGLLRILFQDLFWVFLPKLPTKKDLREEAVVPEPKPTEEEPKADKKNIISSAKTIRPVSRNIDIPKVRIDGGYQPRKVSPKMLHELDMRALRRKNKSRRRAYETLRLKEFQKETEPFDEQTQYERSDSPELMFQMDDIY
ncbi:uncharacterized protein LOC118510470 [Anopheles stephensi]|uniref:uncharacterized protein LOC118510470 n=1 Tax=Anopheles stephensi TaxID=30069 RepID=UPI001658C245|nr:uncharacterized protein LOC118510470 [Anopheles stephensi]